MAKRHPSWTRDELILALDLYTRYNPSRISKDHSEVVALSKILKKLPLHKKIPDRRRFRNPNSVYMKLQNFKACDPSCRAVGLLHANKLEKNIWKEFSQNLETLNKIAVAIKTVANSSIIKFLNDSYAEESDVPQGKLLFRLHKKYEDTSKFVQKKKKMARSLKCEICSFDFEKTYGPVGKGYIEVHHKVPLSQLRPNRKTRLSDFILVCCNCHRVLHRMTGITGTGKLLRSKP